MRQRRWQAVPLSSACYLLPTCDVTRAGLAARAQRRPAPPVLLIVGAREISKNRAISTQLAPLLGVEVPDADHDWRARLATLGRRVADFDLAGF